MQFKMNAIEVRNVKKKFKVYLDKGTTLKERVTSVRRNQFENKWVLNGISFDIKKGESVGLIGHNGCGKSTTLKLLTRIMYPDEGSVKIYGRVSSLLELGAGFHPDMTGIENIYINASIFGLSKKEIDKKLDDIIEFAELGEYIDNPVRTYSSGMYMRLAFAVAINVNADILLIDEILAVGDLNFQTKCFNKLMEIKQDGTTIVLVSHSMEQIEKVCERCIWLQDGKIQMDDESHLVNKHYLNYMDQKRKEKQAAKISQQNKEVIPTKAKIPENNLPNTIKNITRRGSGEARIISVKCCDGNGQECNFFSDGDDIIFKIKYASGDNIQKATFGLCIYRNDGVRCFGCNSRTSDVPKYLNLSTEGEVYLVMPKTALLNGVFDVDVTIENRYAETIDYYDKAVQFEVASRKRNSGVVFLEHEWRYE